MTAPRQSISPDISTSNLGANAGAALAAILFGASVVAVRIAVRDVTPLTLAFLRFAIGAVVLLAGLAVFRRDLLRVSRRDLPYLALLGADVAGKTFDIAPYGIAVDKGAPLTKVIQKTLQSLVDDGTYTTILKKWGVDDGGVKTIEINAASKASS